MNFTLTSCASRLCAYISIQFVFSDKAGAIAVMRQHINGMNEEDAATVNWELVGGGGGLDRGAKMNMDGVKMLLSLCNQFGTPKKTLDDPSNM